VRRVAFVWLQLLTWSAYGVVHYVAALPAVSEAERWHLAGWKACRALTGLLVSTALPWLYRRLPGGLQRPGVVAAKLLGVSSVASLAWAVADRALLTVLVVATRLDVNWARFPRGFDLDYPFVLLAWSTGWLAAQLGLAAAEERRQGAEQRALAREAQVQALTAQLQPHFLFNTLNSVRALVAEDGEAAREMITRLAALLRHGLRADGWCSVGEELAAVRAYLGIQQVRFAERLEATVEEVGAAAGCAVPAHLLLPLVENAVQHGDGAGGPLRVRVRAALEGERLCVEVTSSGALRVDAAQGVGLTALRARLAHAYGARQSFALTGADGRVSARIEIREPGTAGARSPR
jgi:hypothetical protein